MTIRLGDFDDAAVRRLIDYGAPRGGKVWEIGIPNLIEATRRLAAAGYVDGQIAYRLATTRRQVLRWRQYGNIPAALPRNKASQLIRHDLPNLPTDHPFIRGGKRARRTEANRAARRDARTPEQVETSRLNRLGWLHQYGRPQ